MGQEIYNEGRVVGLSAYELFLKQLFSKDTSYAEDPPTEVEWLASMIGMGSSMVLKLPAGTSGIQDFPLPSSSHLTAAGTIVASLFDGNCEWTAESPYWATKVTSYGGLITNTSSHYPTTQSVPSSVDDMTSSTRKSLYAEFAKVTEGIFIQQATVDDGWVENEPANRPPYEDLHHPDFSKQGIIRLYIEDPLARDIYVLFTGFINKTVIDGIAGTNGSTDPESNNWENGGMLGPEIYPWSSKILFMVPNGTFYSDSSYERTLPKAETGVTVPASIGHFTFDPSKLSGYVKSRPLADFNSLNFNEYYAAKSFAVDPRIEEKVESISLGTKQSDNVIVAWYPSMTSQKLSEIGALNTTDAEKEKFFFPPAIYAAQISSTGEKKLVPLDVAAPGTIKVFENPTEAYNYTQVNPNNYAIYHTYDTDNHRDVNYFISNSSGSDINYWQSMSAELKYSTAVIGGKYIDYTNIIIGSKSYETVSLSDSNGERLTLDGSSGTYGINALAGFTWADLLDALHNNYKMDPVGDNLRTFNGGLPNVVTTGNNCVSVGASAMNNPSSGATLTKVDGELVCNVPPKSGSNYYVFSNGLRLYIESNPNNVPDPSTVPEGSIGIGW